MIRTTLAIALGLVAGFAISFGIGVMVITLTNDDSLADFG